MTYNTHIAQHNKHEFKQHNSGEYGTVARIYAVVHKHVLLSVRQLTNQKWSSWDRAENRGEKSRIQAPPAR